MAGAGILPVLLGSLIPVTYFLEKAGENWPDLEELLSFFFPVVSLQLKLGFVCWVVCWLFFFFSFGAVVDLSNDASKLFQALTSRNAASIHVLKCVLGAEEDEEGRQAWAGSHCSALLQQWAAPQ